MAKIGKYRLPLRGIDKMVKLAGQIREKCGSEASRQTIADALGVSATGGAFYINMSALVFYGLAEASGGKIRLTPLAEKILYPVHGAGEAKKAKVEAVERLPIFREIYRSCGANPTEERLKAFLVENAGVARSKVENILPKALKVYKGSIEYIKHAEKSEKPGFGEDIGRGEIPMALKVYAHDVHMELPQTPENIDIAINVLTQLKKRMMRELTKKGKPQIKD